MSSPHFHRLTVADLRRETKDAVSIAFAVPPELASAYVFEPGQYLTLRAALQGEEERRSYSICSGLDDGELRVAVKKVDGGLFSTHVNETLKPGDTIEVMTPMGRFTVPLDPQAAHAYVGIACGSGITPVMSHIKSILSREKKSRFVLLYGNRSSRDIMFKDALEDLKDRHLGRLAVHHVLSREAQDLPLLHGRLDGERITALVRASLPGQKIDHAFLCGPQGMMEAAQIALANLGVPKDRIHLELFTPTSPPPSIRATRARAGGSPGQTLDAIATATVRLDGVTHSFPVAADEGVIDAGLRAGLELPFSCKGGMCCTCRAKLVSGTVKMMRNYSLEPWEMEQGFVLACQSRPTSPAVSLDFDEA
ncbi:MAG TPA: 1,2-phenylacetyl-CoA epoxidase subunit PaaE [Beijerinckiaceae bacterium]|jgi:ring-1,2-phenylacetyl-CoA epoxidase subunit PaaE|nr:1,2-phenylacetyl-CoA epoxidase subunit PaaE [Beijerinckiaceae bacterium]